MGRLVPEADGFLPAFVAALRLLSDAEEEEVVFDGRADAARLVLLEFMPGARVLVIPPEDVIADRLGQFAADPAAGGDQLRIARMVFRLAPALDHAYLHGRIQDETDWRLPWERVRRWLTDEDDTISRP